MRATVATNLRHAQSTWVARHVSHKGQGEALGARRVHAAVKCERDCRPMRPRQLWLLGARCGVTPGEVKIIDAAQLVARIDQATPERRAIVHDVLDNEVRRVPFTVEDEPHPAHLLLLHRQRR